MSTRENIVGLFLDVRLSLIIAEESAKLKQGKSTYIMKLLTEHYKDKLSSEEYNELVGKYSKTIMEQKAEKEAVERLKEEKLDRKLKIQEETLAFKKATSEAYRKQVEISEAQNREAEKAKLHKLKYTLKIMEDELKRGYHSRGCECSSYLTDEEKAEYPKQIEKMKAEIQRIENI